MEGTKTFDVGAFLDRAPVGGFRIAIYILCAIAMLLEGYDTFVVASVLPAIAKGLGVAPAAMTIVFIAQGIGVAVGAYAVTPFSDRYGRRVPILVCLLGFGVLTLLLALTNSVVAFAILRFIAFIFLGGLTPNLVAMTSEFSSTSGREKAVILLFTFLSIGGGSGGFVGPALVQNFGWHMVFWIGGLLPLLLLVPLWLLPESIRFLMVRGNRDREVRNILRRIDRSVQVDDADRLSIREEKIETTPVASLFKEDRARVTILVWIASGAVVGAITMMASWIPTYLHVLAGVDEATAAKSLGLFGIAAVIWPFILMYLMARFGGTRVVGLAYLCGSVAIFGFAFVETTVMNAMVFSLLFGSLVIGTTAGFNAIVAQLYPTAMRATGVGWASGAGRVTSIVGPAFGGFMLANAWSGAEIYSVMAVLSLIGGVAVLLLRMPRGSVVLADAH
jgi:MFS transporter, AAHS family, 4-hydroxybenzoate transporter